MYRVVNPIKSASALSYNFILSDIYNMSDKESFSFLYKLKWLSIE